MTTRKLHITIAIMLLALAPGGHALADDDSEEDAESEPAEKAEKAEKPEKARRARTAKKARKAKTAKTADQRRDEKRTAEAELDAEAQAQAEANVQSKAVPRRWSIAAGPSFWAASIDSTFLLGPVKIHRSVPFAQIMQYFDGGFSGNLEARFDRFTGSANFSTGTLAASTDDGRFGGTLTTKLVEASLGYEVLGGKDARVALALRAGVRYTQLDIEGAGTFDILDTMVSAGGELHRGGLDYTAGVRARVRVTPRVAVIATGDTRIAGDSYSSWSASGDVTVRTTKWLTLQAGWRVLETQSDPTIQRRNGPQVAALVGF